VLRELACLLARSGHHVVDLIALFNEDAQMLIDEMEFHIHFLAQQLLNLGTSCRRLGLGPAGFLEPLHCTALSGTRGAEGRVICAQWSEHSPVSRA